MKRVLTYGEFSHITEGHVAFLRNARDLGDGLVVAINQDGLKPLSDRMDALLKTGLVDAVVPVACCRDCCGLVDKWNISIYAYGNTANKLDMLNCEAMFIDSGMLRIPFLVVVTGQGCSLRCKDCANFSPFAPADTFFYAMDGIILDLRQILRYSTINMLQVQGGEAFLHPHLDTLLRFIIENTRIDGCVIATNGTIVPDIDVSLLKHEKITVRASHYSLTDQQTEELLTYCEINGIRNSVWNFASRTGMWHDLGDGGG